MTVMSRTRTFEIFSDPGHAWIKVCKKDLYKLFGQFWRKHFTNFSYERGEYAYLEEDRDAAMFVDQLKFQKIDFKFKEHKSSESHSRIRRYSPLSPMTPRFGEGLY